MEDVYSLKDSRGRPDRAAFENTLSTAVGPFCITLRSAQCSLLKGLLLPGKPSPTETSHDSTGEARVGGMQLWPWSVLAPAVGRLPKLELYSIRPPLTRLLSVQSCMLPFTPHRAVHCKA
ncbi:hypothetical protein F7725_018893, partial [Dissostichus mawsoni]